VRGRIHGVVDGDKVVDLSVSGVLRIVEGRVGQVKADRKVAERRHFSLGPIVGQLNLDIVAFADCTLFVFTNICQ
jgi:hypothetical protein